MRRSSDVHSSLVLRRAVLTALVGGTSVLFAAGAARADGDAEADASADDLGEVTVVADPMRALNSDPSGSTLGFAKPLLETPRAVSFVSEEQIRAFGVATVEDLSRVVPGTYTTTRYGLQGGINVRGVSADMYYRGMKRLNMQGHVRTVLSAMDNIEVIKGPPSPIYGMGKIGGYTNLDPKSSRARDGKYMTKPTGFFQGLYGSYDKAETQAGLGIPYALGERKGGVYVFGLFEDSNTFVRDVGVKQKFIQATAALENVFGNFRLETGGQRQNSITAGAYMNRVTQNLVDNGIYIRGKPLVNLDSNGDGKIGYVETYLNSPVTGAISTNNQAMTQRYAWKLGTDGNPIPLSQLKDTIVGVPSTLKAALSTPAGLAAANCAAADYIRSAAVPTMTLGTATAGSLVTRNIPQGFFLNPCTVSQVKFDQRGNGAYEREQNAMQTLAYVDLINDSDPDFTIKNQVFMDVLNSFKDSWLPYGENQGIRAVENKLTITKRLKGAWMPEWLGVNTLASVNYRSTRGYLRSSGGDFDWRHDIMNRSYSSNEMFWTQLTNADYATGAPATTWRMSRFYELGAGVMADIDMFEKVNLVVGGRYDSSHATARNYDVQNSVTGTSAAPGLATVPGITVRGKDSGTSYSASLSYQLPYGIRPYATYALSSLTLDGSNNIIQTSVLQGGKFIGEAFLKEAGVKGSVFGGKGQYSLAYFIQSRNDVSAPTDPSESAEVSTTETKGFEAEFKFQPTRNLFVSTYLTYQKGEYLVGANNLTIDVNGRYLGFQDVKDASGNVIYPAEALTYGGRVFLLLTDPNNVYKDVPGVPEWQAGFNTTYTIGRGFGISAGGTWFSDVWADRVKTVKLPAATVLNLGASYDRGPLHIKLNGFNVNDELYYRGAISGRNSGLASVMPGIRYEMSVKYDF